MTDAADRGPRLLGLGIPSWAMILGFLLFLGVFRFKLESEIRAQEKGTGYFTHTWFIEKRESALREEIAALGTNHPRAGIYHRNGESLMLAPRSGYVARTNLGSDIPDLGDADVEEGRLRESNGMIDATGSLNAPSRRDLVPLRWGERHYLVPSEEMIQFANAVNSGSEPHDNTNGDFFLRIGDEKIDVVGTPPLLGQARAILLPHPLRAKIISLGDQVAERPLEDVDPKYVVLGTTVILDVGHKQGVAQGLQLILCNDGYGVGTVLKTYETRSVAAFRQDAEVFQVIRSGMILKTRCP